MKIEEKSVSKQNDQLEIASFANNSRLYSICKDDFKECKERKAESIIDKICIYGLIVSAVFVLWYGIEVIKLVVNI